MVKVKGDEASKVWCDCRDSCRDVDFEGSGCPTRSGIWMSQALFRADVLERFVAHNAAGAIATFAGTTRDRDADKFVDRLHYEAYTPLVMKQMRSICSVVRQKWNIARIAIQHRVGDVGVGQVSVRIAVSSEHRAEALAAVAFIIDQLKAQAAIFKREHYVDRSAAWKPNRKVQQSEADGQNSEAC